MRERKATAVNLTKERMVILVKLRITLSRHTSVTHHNIYAVRNVNLHLPSGKWTFVDSKAGVCAAHLTFSGERVQDFVLRVGAEALLKVD